MGYRIKIETIVLIWIFMCLPDISAFMETVGFNSYDCGKYRHYLNSGQDSYQVIWNGEQYPEFCSLRFTMKGIDTYRVCADITEFNMKCDVSVTFYWSVSLNQRMYDCNNDKLPITYCNEEGVYIKLEPNYGGKRESNSRLRIKVTASLISTYGSNSSGSYKSEGSMLYVFVGMAAAVVVVILIVCCAVKYSKQTAARNTHVLNRSTCQHVRENINLLPSHGGRRDHLNPNAARESSPYHVEDHTGSHFPRECTRYPDELSNRGNPHPSVPHLDNSAGYLGQQTYNPGQSSHPASDHSVPPPSYDEVVNKEKYNVV